MRELREITVVENAKVIVTSALVSLLVCAAAACVFFKSFYTKYSQGACEVHGWRMEGSGPYQHKHCYDPKTGIMYLPPEIDP